MCQNKLHAFSVCFIHKVYMGNVYKISESILIQSLNSTYLEVGCCTHMDHVVYTYNHINAYILSYIHKQVTVCTTHPFYVYLKLTMLALTVGCCLWDWTHLCKQCPKIQLRCNYQRSRNLEYTQ